MNLIEVKTRFFLGGIVVLLLLFGLQTVYADTTSTLRPIADGGDDSANWSNTGGTACNATGCYLEVDESAGSSCTNSDGDISYIEGSVQNATQTFDVDVSSITNDSIITAINIVICHKKGETGAANPFQTRRCIDGTCTDSGTDISPGNNYTETTQSHTGLSITKSASTDIEIGLDLTGNKNKKSRISQISATITYTLPPTPTPTPTPTPSEPPTPTPSETPTPTPSETPTPTPSQEPATVETGSSGGNYPAELVFSGEVYPGAKIQINLLSDFYGKILKKEDEYTVGDTGKFTLETKGNSTGEQFYGLSIKDRNDNQVIAKFFKHDLKFNTIVKQENIILAPMASISKKIVAKSEAFMVSGYGAPGNKIEILSNSKVVGTSTVLKDGSYAVKIDGGKLFLGPHKIQARQVDDTTDKAGDLSGILNVTIGQFSYTSVDMNKDDKINIADWSIFLYNWSAPDKETRAKNDLNSDGIIDVTDFSVFLTSFQLHL